MAVQQIRGSTQIMAGTILDAQIAAGAAIALSKLAEAVIQADGGQAFTADQSMGGFKLTSLGTPTAASDAVTKAYVDSLTLGLSWKDSVRVATTAAGTLATSFENGDTVDGITLATGDRLLVKDQAAPAENGIYTVNASGAPTRATDMDSWLEVPAATVAVEVGTVNADTIWICTSDQGGTLNTTAITFTSLPSATILAGAGLLKTGNTIDFVTADTSLTVNANDVAVNLNTTGGLETSTGVRMKLDATTDGYATLATGANGARVVSIKNANVAADAALVLSKLASGTSAQIIVANGSGVPTYVAMSGDATISNAGVVTVDATFVKNADVVTNEIPSGTVNGSNVTFTLAFTPVAGTEQVRLNGLGQLSGGSNDYTISGAVITYNTAPLTGDVVSASYIK